MNKQELKTDTLIEYFPDEKYRNFLIDIINTLPGFVLILDEDRRLLHSNRSFSDSNIITNFDKALNARPGELFQCVNSNKNKRGCGFSESCELCGAFRAMAVSKQTGERISEDFKILAKDKGLLKSYNFVIHSSAFLNEGKQFYIVSLEDISNKKRKEELEKIFFHDILNSISSLFGIIYLIKQNESLDTKYADILEAIYNTLLDIVMEQKQFMQAENKKLNINTSELHSMDILIEVRLHFNENTYRSSNLVIAEDSINTVFQSDDSLLKRILINMIKNALEASDNQDKIQIGTKFQGDKLRFWVHNPGVIPKNTQLLIFERSNSTKGSGRGLGTFSMKLLGENYLGGQVDFKSSEEEGTTFWIDLPIK